LGYLVKTNQPRLRVYVWTGAGAGILVSVLAAVVLRLLTVKTEEDSFEIFEAAVGLVAVGVLTWTVLWMQRQSRFIKGRLEDRLGAAPSSSQALALLGLAFLSVVREGLEAALFLSATFLTERNDTLLPGALLGLLAAIGIGYLVFHSTLRLNLGTFFVATGSLLILFAAGLVGHTVMDLQALGWLPIATGIAWNSGWLISNDGLLGQSLRTLVGYEAAPSWLMVLSYAGYLAVIGTKYVRTARHGLRRLPSQV
jgi:high-affinity iron transporter